jgi:hypothetical protein
MALVTHHHPHPYSHHYHHHHHHHHYYHHFRCCHRMPTSAALGYLQLLQQVNPAVKSTDRAPSNRTRLTANMQPTVNKDQLSAYPQHHEHPMKAFADGVATTVMSPLA